jgi:hypothetical protein
MHHLKSPAKKGALAGGQAAWYDKLHIIRYSTQKCLSTQNHKFFLTQGRRVFERPANWDARLRR